MNMASWPHSHASQHPPAKTATMAPRMEDEDAVHFVHIAHGNAAKVTLALASGMTAHELQLLVAAALQLPSQATCTGFLVHPRVNGNGNSATNGGARHHTRKGRRHDGGGASKLPPRIVPLAVACVSPYVLTVLGGRVEALVSWPAVPDKHTQITPAGSHLPTARTNGLTHESHEDSAANGGERWRVERLLKALQTEEPSLSQLETVVLAEMCDVRAKDVLRVIQSRQSLEAKKRYLLALVRSRSEEKNATTRSADRVKQRHSERATHANGHHRMGTRSESESGESDHGVMPTRAASEADAQLNLICKKLVAIAHTVFSPHVQSDLMTEASRYREQQQQRTRLKQQSLGNEGDEMEAERMRSRNVLDLLGVVERLLNKHALPEEQSGELIRLILGENRLLLSALQSYRMDLNLNELEHTIKRMAELGVTQSSGLTGQNGNRVVPATQDAALVKASKLPRGATRQNNSRHKQQQQQPHQQHQPVRSGSSRPDRKGFIVRPEDILHTLYQKDMITTLEMDLLRALIAQSDRQVLSVVGEYEHTRDLEALRHQLVSIVDEITAELGDEEKLQMLWRNHGPPPSAVAPWHDPLTQFVQHWFVQHHLTVDQVQVLSTLIAANHELLQSAYEVFAADRDEQELLDTLQRVAKLQLQAQEDASLQAFSVIVDTQCHALRAPERVLVKQLFARRSELVRAAWEVYEETQNVEELGDTLLRIARFTTRQDSKLRVLEVVGEMMRRNLIRSHEGDGLIRLFEERNEAMMAAKEVFEADEDVKELVETLLLIVKHANFGEPPQCSTPRHGGGEGGINTNGGSNTKLPMTPPSSPILDGEDAEVFYAGRLLEILASKGRLVDWQLALLLALLAQGDVRLLAIVDVYNEDRNARELVDTLWRLCDLTAWDQNSARLVKEWVTPLEDRGLVERGLLTKLIQQRDDRVVAAFVVFLGDGRGDEFADTLRRIASIEAAKLQTDGETADIEEAVNWDAVRDAVKEVSVSLSESELARFDARVAAGDSMALAALDVYQECHDVNDFVDTIKRILSLDKNGGHTDDTGEESDTAEEKKGTDASSSTLVMEKQLLHLASEMGLTEAEVGVLKTSISGQNPQLRAAVQSYHADKDEAKLKDVLRSVATISEK